MTVLFGKKINAILRWKNSDKKVWVGYFFPYSQSKVDSDDLNNEEPLLNAVKKFCDKNNLTLWSY